MASDILYYKIKGLYLLTLHFLFKDPKPQSISLKSNNR